MLLPPLLIAYFLASGHLTVHIQETPGGSVARGAQRVPMMTLKLRASCNADVDIDGITVSHRGLGIHDDIDSVYLMEGSTRLTDGRPIANTNGRVSIPLRQFTIHRCTSRTLTLMANISPDALPSGEHRFILESPADIETDASVTFTSNRCTVNPRRRCPR